MKRILSSLLLAAATSVAVPAFAEEATSDPIAAHRAEAASSTARRPRKLKSKDVGMLLTMLLCPGVSLAAHHEQAHAGKAAATDTDGRIVNDRSRDRVTDRSSAPSTTERSARR